jgi:Putative zinc-finger
MDHAPLRPVPTRLTGPVHPGAAARAVVAALPELDTRASRALALVALAGRPRPEVTGELGIGSDELGEALARGRKALRRSLQPLSGSGWCERAERLISDRLDGELAERGAARLDVHLRNCPRCVEHERRLVQATDALMAAAAGPPAAPSAEAPAAPPVELSLVGVPAPEEPEITPEPNRGRAWSVHLVVAVLLALALLALIAAGILSAIL